MRTRSYHTGLVLALVALVATALPAFADARDNDLADACEGAPETTFADEASLTSEEEEATDCLAAEGWENIVEGYGDNTYRPRENVRREQMAAFIARTLAATGVTLPASPANAFDDDDTSAFHLQINQLAELGVISGRPDTNDADGDGDTEENLFFPKDPVRRDQMAKFIANAIEETSGENLTTTSDQFPDEDCDESLEPDVNALAAENIVKGTGDGYNCDGNVSRGQMSLFLARTLDWLVENGYENNPFQTSSGLIDAPELVSAAVTNSTSTTTVVRFTFDEALSGTPAAGCFHLYKADLSPFASGAQNACNGGHAGDVNTADVSADGASAVLASSNTAVDVTFAVGSTELAQVTTATVDFDAVTDVDGTENPEGAEGLDSYTFPARRTVAPDLTAVENFNATAGTVEFVFDEAVGAVLNQDGFVLIETDGDVKVSDAAAVSGTDSTRVVATFDNADNDGTGGDAPAEPGIAANQATTTARGAVLQNAVSDTAQDTNQAGTEGETNPLQAVAVANNGNSDDPDLLSIELDREKNQVFFRFDTSVNLGGNNATCDDSAPPLQSNDQPGNCFHLYDRAGNQYNASSVTVDSSAPEQVIATYTADQLSESVGVSLDENAVVGRANTVGNEIDAEGIASSEIAAGRTTGPDLVSAQRQTNTSSVPGSTDTVVVVFTFDEALNRNQQGALVGADANRFFLYEEDGTVHEGQSVAPGDNPNQVEVTFSSNAAVEGSRSAGINDKAVEDSAGNDAVEGYTILLAEE